MHNLKDMIIPILFGLFISAVAIAGSPTGTFHDHLQDQRGNALTDYWIGFTTEADTTTYVAEDTASGVSGYSFSLPSGTYRAYVCKIGATDSSYEKTVVFNVPLNGTVYIGASASDTLRCRTLYVINEATFADTITGIIDSCLYAKNATEPDSVAYADSSQYADSSAYADAAGTWNQAATKADTADQWLYRDSFQYNSKAFSASWSVGDATDPLFIPLDTIKVIRFSGNIAMTGPSAKWTAYLINTDTDTLAQITAVDNGANYGADVTIDNPIVTPAQGLYILLQEDSGAVSIWVEMINTEFYYINP